MRLRELFFESLDRTGENKSAVVGWGRGMGHKGHMLLAQAVIHHAQENNAKPYFIVSRTSLVDPSTGQAWTDKPTFTKTKDDPLSPEEKLATYRKVFPKNADVFTVATADASTLDKVLTKIAGEGFSKVILIVGEQEKASFSFLTRPDKSGIPPYQRAGLKDLEIISRQDTTEPSSVKGSPSYQEGPRATPMRQVLLDPNKSEDEQFAVWRRDMPDNLSDEDVKDLMLKAKSRMMAVPAAKNRKQSVSEDVTEGVNDPHTFKCIFLFGPMGAGKSTVAKPLLSHTGLRSVNLDNFNELFIKKGEVPTGHLAPNQLEKSWQLSQTQQNNFIDGRLGVIIDGSGRNPDTAIGVIEKLMPLGYEFMMIFVNVSEATSIARQQSRADKQQQQWGVGRQVDPTVAKNTYSQVQKNLEKYSAYFGPQKFVYVDNENTPNLSQATKKVDAFLRAPATQPEAIKWIQSQKGGGQIAQQQQKLAKAQDRQQQALKQYNPLNPKFSRPTTKRDLEKTDKSVGEEAAGVGIVTKQNSTADVGPGTLRKNLKAFNLTK